MRKLDAGSVPLPVTEDMFLGGRLRLFQPRTSARAGADAVFLAAAIPAKACEQVIEIGSGAGAAMLCLAARITGVEVVGIEVEPELAALARLNADKNGFSGHVTVRTADVAELFAAFAPGTVNHVMANPPFFEAGRVAPPADAKRRRARVATEGELDLWLRFAAHVLMPRGSLTLIWRTDRLPALLAGLAGRFGGISVFPLWPRPGRAAKLLIIQGFKGSGAPFRLCPGLMLHGAGTAYTAAAEAILRHGAALGLQADGKTATAVKRRAEANVKGRAQSKDQRSSRPACPISARCRLARSS